MMSSTAILASYLKDETLHEDIDLDKLAAQTDGFSGSDLKS
jgi:ATP-dependent Zn protease